MTISTGVSALIPAAGRGVRFGSSENKVFAPLLERPLLGWTLEAFARCRAVDSVVLIGGDEDLPRLQEIAQEYGGEKALRVVRGGEDRQASVAAGLDAAAGSRIVLVHDAARPCVTPELLHACIDAAVAGGAATAAVPVSDTLVRGVRAPGTAFAVTVGEVIPRDDAWSVQTPQAFDGALLAEAHRAAERDGFRGTDDAGLVRRLGHPVTVVPGSPENLKVTRREDLALAEAILARQARPTAAPIPFRIGYGYDVHPFAEGRPLYLGGVHFPDAPRGLEGHSDADVLLHAVCDALLGAAGLGDIGKLFPNTDAAHKNRRSGDFLREVGRRILKAGWDVGNLDVMVLAETPKIGPRADEIRAYMASILGISPETVSIKATTNEGLGFVGRGEGIAVHATALLARR